MRKFFPVIIVGLLLIASGCSLNKPAPKPDTSKVASGVTIDGAPVGNLPAAELEAMVNKLAAEKYTAPVNAGFDEAGNITAGRKGRQLNIGATAGAAMAASPNSHIAAVYQDITPAVTAETLKNAVKIGTYTSPILNDQPGRMENIRLTAKLITNMVIEPGSEFSFNRTTGEPTVERGFKAATVFADDGRHEQEVGGGMCQVSSTLYSAVLNAKLQVTERHPHSQPVNYVPVNRDATIYTDKDFRFINNTRRPIIIRAFVSGKRLTVDLLSLPRYE